MGIADAIAYLSNRKLVLIQKDLGYNLEGIILRESSGGFKETIYLINENNYHYTKANDVRDKQ